mgnify:CR=1 FL=1
MREVTVRKGEPIDRALKRLKTKLDVEGILDEMRRRRAFETPMDERQQAQQGKMALQQQERRNRFRNRRNTRFRS